MDCSEEVGGEGVNNHTRDTYDSSVRSVSERQRVREGDNLKTIKDGSGQVTACFSFLWFVSFLYRRNIKKRNEHN